jgi:hypothetical protein
MEQTVDPSGFGVKAKIVVDEITYSGSAFGSTHGGDRVYIKANLLEDADRCCQTNENSHQIAGAA